MTQLRITTFGKPHGADCIRTQWHAETRLQGFVDTELLDQLRQSLEKHGVSCSSDRAANFDIKPGVSSDEGDGDDWPAMLKKIMAADILVMTTPIWMGQPSSVSKRVLEWLDAVLDDIDDKGRYRTFGKVAIVGVVGNEDGAHHVSAEFYQALTDVGFGIPGGSSVYWVGEAMSDVDYNDLKKPPKKIAEAIKTLASNAAHLAKILKKLLYPTP